VLKPDQTEPEHNLKTIDLVSIMLILIGIMLFTTPLISPWAGKAEFFLTELLMFVVVLLFIKLQGFPVKKLIRWNPLPRKIWMSVTMLVVGNVILLDELDRVVSLIMPMPIERIEELNMAFKFTSVGDAIWIILGVVIAAPIIEETIFRGIFQGTLERSINPTQAVLWTSLIFAILHFQIWWIIQLLILSVVLGYLCWRSNSIFPAVLIHTGNNLMTILLMNTPDQLSFGFYLWHGHVNPLLLLIALALFWFGFKSFESGFTNSRYLK
jgi:membrane protease YdiL (CAAX protease family)